MPTQGRHLLCQQTLFKADFKMTTLSKGMDSAWKRLITLIKRIQSDGLTLIQVASRAPTQILASESQSS